MRDFLRAVYFATGKVYGSQFYRRLLKEYAPQRRPSTATIELELEYFRGELRDNEKKHSLAESSDVPAASHEHKGLEAGPATNAMDSVDRRLLQQVLHRLDSISALLQSKELQSKEAPVPVAQNCEMPPLTQFYQKRLIAAETELSKVRMENQALLANAMTVAADAAEQYYEHQMQQKQDMIQRQEMFLKYAAATENRIRELEHPGHVTRSGNGSGG